MLKLSRHAGETVVVIAPSGERITFAARPKYGHRNRFDVGIDAPPAFAIHRGECLVDVVDDDDGDPAA